MIFLTIFVLIVFLFYLIFAFYLKFLPYGRIKKSIKSKNGLSSLMILLGSSMGVGNIVGVGVAIYLAGPGVIFWMLISSLISASTNYLEVYSSKTFSQDLYNPISYIDNKYCSYLYSIVMILTSLFIGNLTQINSIKIALNMFDPKILIFATILMFVMCTYKSKNIDRSLSLIMPIISILYLIIGIYLLINQKDNLGNAIDLIIKCAFQPQSTLGIPFFYVFNQGVLFAVFSNEAGNGSSAMAFKDSKGDAKELGVVASLGPIIDTAIICVLTGLIILSNNRYINFNYQNINPNETIYIVDIYRETFGKFGLVLMCFMIVLFAFATLISWFYYACLGVKYLKLKYIIFYAIYVVLIAVGMFAKLSFGICYDVKVGRRGIL